MKKQMFLLGAAAVCLLAAAGCQNRYEPAGAPEFLAERQMQEEAGGTEALLTAGAALGQFMQALAAAGFGGIVLSGSLLADASLQSAFCRDAAEKLVAWITIGTPKPDAPKPMPEDRQPVLSVWEAQQC